jgi:hypothetical protein
VNHPFDLATHHKLKAKKQSIIDNNLLSDDEHRNCNMDCSTFQLVTPKAGRILHNLSSLQSKLLSFEQHWCVVLVCGIASFARMALVNVDLGGKIGPLLDADHNYHDETYSSELLQYPRLSGSSNTE